MTTPTSGASLRGAFLRHHLWRLVFGCTGGLTVTGPLPHGPAVLVANHSSHVDTAALMAAIPAAGRPVFAAAADYWFAQPVRRFLVTTLAAAVPVERQADWAYAALRSACEPVLAAGGIVIVYPEGTRSTDGAVGRFASGAVRLANDLSVPVVPVALLGTREVLPKNGSFQSVPVEVRFLPSRRDRPASRREQSQDRAAQLREDVLGLRDDAPLADPRSPLGVVVERLMGSPWGLVGLRLGLRGGRQLAAHRRDLSGPGRRDGAAADGPGRGGALGGVRLRSLAQRGPQPSWTRAAGAADHRNDAAGCGARSRLGGVARRAAPGVQRHTGQGVGRRGRPARPPADALLRRRGSGADRPHRGCRRGRRGGGPRVPGAGS